MPTIVRSPVTDAVLAAIAGLGFPVGDGRLPAGANWVGQPNTPGTVFRPYFVVSEIVASHSSGGFGDSQADWQMPYLVEAFGITREQCSKVADRAFAAMKAMRSQRFTLDGAPYGVQQVRIDSIGAPVRVDQAKPPVWHSQTGTTIWLGKGN